MIRIKIELKQKCLKKGDLPPIKLTTMIYLKYNLKLNTITPWNYGFW
jgi:hypothetical protein